MFHIIGSAVVFCTSNLMGFKQTKENEKKKKKSLQLTQVIIHQAAILEWLGQG